MSVVVSLADLPTAIDAQIGWCYLLTVSDDGEARVVAVAPVWDATGSFLHAEVGRRTAANVTSRPKVSLVWPPATADGYSLIADGVGAVDANTVDGTIVHFEPTSAVLHRPAVQATPS